MKHIFLTFLLTLALSNLSAHTAPPADSEVQAALANLDDEFNEAFAWWAQVWDPKTGGAYYSISAKEAGPTDPRFGPDIESTEKLIEIMRQTGLLEKSPPEFRKRVVKYLQGLQSPESGMFRDPQHADQYDHHTLSRVTGMAIGKLEMLGAEPLHPTPLDRTDENQEAAEHFAHLESPDAMEAWLRALPWEENIWTVGARLRAQWNFIEELPKAKRTALIKRIEQVVREKQREDGFWGPAANTWAYQLSGTYKITAFLNKGGVKAPRAEAMEKTLLHYLFEADYDNSIVLYNTANLVNILHEQGANFDLQQRLRIVRRVTELLHTMRAPDGAFFTHTYRPTPVEMGKLLGKDVVESNTNASGLAFTTRQIMIEFLTGRSSPHPHPKGDDLINGLQAATTTTDCQ